MANEDLDAPRKRGRPTIEPQVWARVLPILKSKIGRGKEFTAAAVAEAVGLTPPAVSQWLHDTNRPDLAHALKALRFIGADLSMLGAAGQIDGGVATVDSKAMADEAVEMLVEIDGLEPAEAAGLMVGIRLDPPSVRGFYKAARLKYAPRTRPEELEPQPRTRKRR